MEEKTIQVLVVDDHPQMRKVVRALLDKEHDIQIVATAKDGQEAVTLSKQLHPDVVIMDVAMPRVDGIEAMQQIRALESAPRVVLLSVHADSEIISRALRTHVQAYVEKQHMSRELVKAVRAVHDGKEYFSTSVAPFTRPARE